MEKITLIKKDIQEKSSKEWLGLQKQTEDRLDSLMWYLDHPKMQESPKLVEEIVELYYAAKNTNFIKMEGIIRKLDQLTIKFSKEGAVKKTKTAQSHAVRGEQVIYEKAIEEFIKKVDDFLNSTSGTSLPEKTKKSLITFLGYLNHPVLIKKTALFDEMKDKYDKTVELDFLSMQTFDDMLNMCDIKLGAITDEMKTFKSPEKRKKELDEAWGEFEAEKEKFQAKLNNLESEREAIKAEREKIETERSQINLDRENLLKEQEEFKVKNDNLKQNLQQYEVENENLKQDRARMETERENLKLTQENLQIKKENIDAKQEKLDRELEKLKIE